MPENYQQATVARSLALAAGPQTLDADIAKTQADPGISLGPLFRVSSAPARWAVIPAASTDEDAEPIDGAGLLVNAVAVRRSLDANGALLGFSRDPSTAENNAGTLLGHWFVITDTNVARGDLVYLTVLDYDNAGPVAAMRIVAISGLEIVGTPT
jgi:hypothetical protein